MSKNKQHGHNSLRKNKISKKEAHEQMIKGANARHDKEFGINPSIINYATHTPGRRDITQKR